MGHQVNFFVMPADLPDLEAAIRSTGDICFLADRSPAAQPVELGTIAPGGQATEPPCLMYFIVRRQDYPKVSTRFTDTQGCWLIDGSRSPVVEFSPGRFSGSELTRGRAYFATDPRFRPEPPSADFIRWGDRVLSGLKKRLTRQPVTQPPWLYFGARARQWIHDSGATAGGGAFSFTISGNGPAA